MYIYTLVLVWGEERGTRSILIGMVMLDSIHPRTHNPLSPQPNTPRPFICPTSAGAQTAPAPLPYLQDAHYSSFDITLEVALQPDTAPPGRCVCVCVYINKHTVVEIETYT